MDDGREYGWFRIHNSVIDDYDLTPHELAVYVVIARHVNNKSGVSFPGYKLIAKEAHVSERHVPRCLSALETKGLLSIVRSKNAKGEKQANQYTLLGGGEMTMRSTDSQSVPTDIESVPVLTGSHDVLTHGRNNNTKDNNTKPNKIEEQEPVERPTPPSEKTVAPAAQVLSDPEPERETPQPDVSDAAKPTKAERDAVFDALAQHLLGLTPRSPAVRSQGWLLGPMTSWCFGSTVKVRSDGAVHDSDGCAYSVTADMIPQFVRDYKREHPDADLPTTLAGFIKHFSIWLDRRTAKAARPPAPTLTPEQVAAARTQQFTLSDEAKAAFARKAANHAS